MEELKAEEILHFSRYPPDTHDNINKFLKTLNELEVTALKIAQKDLGSSFNILKCIGYQKWLKNNL